jgi:hypothetical protein
VRAPSSEHPAQSTYESQWVREDRWFSLTSALPDIWILSRHCLQSGPFYDNYEKAYRLLESATDSIREILAA